MRQRGSEAGVAWWVGQGFAAILYDGFLLPSHSHSQCLLLEGGWAASLDPAYISGRRPGEEGWPSAIPSSKHVSYYQILPMPVSLVRLTQPDFGEALEALGEAACRNFISSSLGRNIGTCWEAFSSLSLFLLFSPIPTKVHTILSLPAF